MTVLVGMTVFQNQDLQDCDDAGASFSPSDPVSSTGTGSLIPLPSRERGIVVVDLSCCMPGRRPSGLRIKSAMTGLPLVDTALKPV